uniref:Mitochondrial ribosomal protein S18B n=1 Tax=Rattus norvegicus TaxID=10116 RepID=A0A8I6AI67_RAT
MLHPHFPSPLLRTNLGNTWIQKNTRTAMALALFGLTTAATTKVVCHHSGPERHAFVRIKWLGILAPSAGITSCMLTLGGLYEAAQEADPGHPESQGVCYYVPQVEPRDADLRTVHGAVSVTPPAPTLLSGEPWYPWYSWQQPPERELSRLRRLYQGNLLEASGPPPESM